MEAQQQQQQAVAVQQQQVQSAQVQAAQLQIDALGAHQKKQSTKKRGAEPPALAAARNSKKKLKKPHPSVWTAEENKALMEGVEKWGLDFERIKEESGGLLVKRSAGALMEHLYTFHRNIIRELRAEKPSNRTDLWTEEEKATLLEGMEKHGLDCVKIKAESGERLGKRSANALYVYLHHHHPKKFSELRTAAKSINRPVKTHPNSWTKEEKAALLSGVEKHGRDWEKIKASNGDRLAKRSKIALQQHLRDHHPDKYKELREPMRTDLWTEEEDAALLEGAEKYGHDWDKIKAESGGRLGKRSARAIEDHLRRLK
ncbi:hypothetical protein TL16_g11073 [Triparma laevis f. inornata]|uniref:Uncharacterized protein n=2 Tax=Triparma laevis TaxID=1534972 RepID=A0A9W7BXH0_9STRA|nr:hypothetical protein TL16_g11073 [Triparma laevis f. inornata]GMH99296.1 hypothetical protein TrLO_g8380 [Triparma laevis f. longispina]